MYVPFSKEEYYTPKIVMKITVSYIIGCLIYDIIFVSFWLAIYRFYPADKLSIYGEFIAMCWSLLLTGVAIGMYLIDMGDIMRHQSMRKEKSIPAVREVHQI